MNYPEKITHAELVELGMKWLVKPYAACAEYGHSGCAVVISELVTSLIEQPDVLGFNGRKSILIECKASRADFNHDSDKIFRQCPQIGVGEQRWYMAPQGLIPHDRIPPKWGLLEVLPGRQVLVTKKAEPQQRDPLAEIVILLSLFRRLDIPQDGHVAVRKYEIKSDKNRAAFYVDKEK